jgi:Skp family chaperone for outer membrane proteins
VKHLAIFLCLLIFTGGSGSTAAGQDENSVNHDRQFDQRRNNDPIAEKMERDRLKALNKQRYDELKKDTDKLLQLANELKESVDKANEHTLSLEVIKKTEEVEKLAKKVREKMKDNYGPSNVPFGR